MYRVHTGYRKTFPPLFFLCGDYYHQQQQQLRATSTTKTIEIPICVTRQNKGIYLNRKETRATNTHTHNKQNGCCCDVYQTRLSSFFLLLAWPVFFLETRICHLRIIIINDDDSSRAYPCLFFLSLCAHWKMIQCFSYINFFSQNEKYKFD